MATTYRNEFQNPLKADSYESRVYSPDSYGSLLWAVEREFLLRFLDRFQVPREQIAYLDFACGTGRVLSFMEEYVGTARGIEVAAPMLELARGKVKRADLVHADITARPDQIEGTYDLITAFRFFLNAEPALRRAVMDGLAARLRDGNSRLIFNIQASVPGHKSIVREVRRFHHPDGAGTYHVMSSGGVEELVAAAGLQIEEKFGYDMMSGAALRVLPARTLLNVERRLAGTPVANALGGHQIYVVRRA